MFIKGEWPLELILHLKSCIPVTKIIILDKFH